MHDSTFRMCWSTPEYTVSLHGDQKVWLYVPWSTREDFGFAEIWEFNQ